jgi:hypothetical protein
MIEISRQSGAFTYRISPSDPLLIERRQNKHGARWLGWQRYAGEDEARQALLEIGREGEGK